MTNPSLPYVLDLPNIPQIRQADNPELWNELNKLYKAIRTVAYQASLNTGGGGLTAVTLTDASNITPAASGFTRFYLLTTNAVGPTRNIAVPTGSVEGDILNWEIVQPSSGGGTQIVWATGFRWGLGGQSTAPFCSSVNNASDFYSGEVQKNGDVHMAQIGQSGPAGANGTNGTNGTNGSGAPTGISGRLTLTSGVPVTTTDVTAATTIYWTPYQGNNLVLWDGTAWTGYSSAELPLALGTKTSGLPYDVFIRQVAGVPTIDDLAWTSATARATAVTLQDGRYCKSGDKTRLYVGTYFTTATTTTEDSDVNRYVWNQYNRLQRRLRKTDATSHSYNGGYRQWNNSANNQVNFIVGLLEDTVVCTVASDNTTTATGQYGVATLGLDVTNVLGTAYGLTQGFSGESKMSSLEAYLPAIGKHFIAAIEGTVSLGAVTFANFLLAGYIKA